MEIRLTNKRLAAINRLLAYTPRQKYTEEAMKGFFETTDHGTPRYETLSRLTTEQAVQWGELLAAHSMASRIPSKFFEGLLLDGMYDYPLHHVLMSYLSEPTEIQEIQRPAFERVCYLLREVRRLHGLPIAKNSKSFPYHLTSSENNYIFNTH